MKESIKNNLDDPKQLETLYRDNKSAFKKAFDELYPEIREHLAARVWNERLSYDNGRISWGAKHELGMVVILSLIAGLIAKIPDFFGVNTEFFISRNLSLVVFPALAAWFAWKQGLAAGKMGIAAGIVVLSAVYINLLPGTMQTHTLVLACIHLPVLLWMVMGFAYTGDECMSLPKRIEFLRYNGDLLVMTGLILVAGAIMTGVTMGLFQLIGLNIEQFYFHNVAIWGLAASPIVATWLVRSNPTLVKNVSPVIARVFTPLVLVMLVVYLAAIVYTGKDPYNDRDFLLIFNLLLVGVMAIILFSVAESSTGNANRISTMLLFLLAVVTVVVNGIALSAILYRITSWGITPNRLAVLGSNLLILVNLLMVTWRLFRSLKDPEKIAGVDGVIAWYLPVYGAWAAVVAFLFPVLFGFR